MRCEGQRQRVIGHAVLESAQWQMPATRSDELADHGHTARSRRCTWDRSRRSGSPAAVLALRRLRGARRARLTRHGRGCARARRTALRDVSSESMGKNGGLPSRRAADVGAKASAPTSACLRRRAAPDEAGEVIGKWEERRRKRRAKQRGQGSKANDVALGSVPETLPHSSRPRVRKPRRGGGLDWSQPVSDAKIEEEVAELREALNPVDQINGLTRLMPSKRKWATWMSCDSRTWRASWNRAGGSAP